MSSPVECLAFVGATVYPTPYANPISNGVVVVCGRKITAVSTKPAAQIPPSAREVDCPGLTITAGLWNSHVHFFERKWADAANLPADELSWQLQDAFTRYGFTSVFDLSSLWGNTQSLRARIDSRELSGPGIRSTGEGMVPPNTVPSEQILNLMGVMPIPMPEVASPAQALAAARNLLNSGVDGLKVFAPAGRTLEVNLMLTVVEEAHRLGKPVFVHPNSATDVMAAIECGVDVIAHTTPRTGLWDQSVFDLVKNSVVALTPTLHLWKHFLQHDRSSTQQQITEIATSQLRDWIASGGRVLFGTDFGVVEADPTEEYLLMRAAGMDFREILASLTTTPAEMFGEANRLGQVAVGFDADLAILRGDPSKNIGALARPKYTVRGGEIIYQAPE